MHASSGPGSVHRCQCEVLEQRQLFAGQVSIAVLDGDLLIYGDSAANKLTLDQRGLPPGSVRVTAYGTQVNGDELSLFAPLVFTGVTGGIRAWLSDGDDRLTLQDLTLQGSVAVRGGLGQDSLLLFNVVLGGGLWTGMAAGADSVHLYDTRVAQEATIFTGLGADVVNLDGCTFAQAVRVETRIGRDSIAVANNTCQGSLVLDPGPGINQVLVNGTVRQSFDFRNGSQGWLSGFADYATLGVRDDGTIGTIDPVPWYRMESGIRPLPEELGLAGSGYYISGANHSDDLFMFLKRKLGPESGVVAGWTYDVAVSVRFATNVAAGMVGMGGPPGEAVWVKAGASVVEPAAVEVASDEWRLNLDMGAQANSGPDGTVIGNIANGLLFTGDETLQWREQTRAAARVARVTADANGELWICVGTDSGYEGITELYYTSIQVTLTPVLNADQVLRSLAPASLVAIGDAAGNPTNDTIVVRHASDPTYIEAIVNGEQQALVPAATVSSVAVYGLAGDDSIDIKTLNIAASVYGGAGNDSVYGGNAADTIKGDEGNDLLYGYSGDDSIYVHDGEVLYFHDTVDGGNGYDRVSWDAWDSVLNVEELIV